MTSLKLDKIFFEALNLPPYARPNFFIIKQAESGWSKGVYLTTLSEIYHTCITILQINHGSQKRSQPDLKIEDISLPLKDFNFLDENLKKEDKQVNKKILDELQLSIIAAYSFNELEKKYSSYEILSFVEYALWFIRNEFRIQTKEIHYPNFRPRTETYFIYHIAQNGPFFDFPKFKSAIHELTFTCNNYGILKKKLTPFYNAAKQIVELYNNKVYLIEDTVLTNENRKAAEIVRVEFIASSLKHSWRLDQPMFELKYPKPYLNQDLAGYSAQIANFLADIVLPKTRKELKAFQKNFIEDLLLGIQDYMDTDESPWKKPTLEKPNHERHYRDYFHHWFKASKYTVEREPLKGIGKIDLKVSHASIGNRIIEFKGWWNPKRKNTINQLFGYLTEFDGDSFVVIINTTGKNIISAYQEITSQIKENDTTVIWEEKMFLPTSYRYYKSTHEINGIKRHVFHFIINGPTIIKSP